MSPLALNKVKTRVKNRTVESVSTRDLSVLAYTAGRRAHQLVLKKGFRATQFVDGKLMWIYPDVHFEPFAKSIIGSGI